MNDTAAVAGRRRSDERTPTRRRGWLLATAIVLAAVNLRTAATSVGPLLDDARAGLGMSSALAGVLTTLPVLCFAGFGALAPALARRWGARGTLLLAFLVTAAGLTARALASDVWLFLAASVLALCGGAVGNVLIPVVVKRWFPDRLGAATTLYTTMLALGTALGAALAVPIARAGGSWRYGLGAWAALALVGAAPWLALVRDRSVPDVGRAHLAAGPADGGGRRASSLLRHPLAWSLTIFFGAQGAQAYVFFGWLPAIFRDDGVSASTAGLLLAFLSGLSVPVSLLVSPLTARSRDQRWLVMALIACSAAGFAGLLVWPAAGAWLWALLVGVGAGCFPVSLTMIAVKTRNPADTVALSAFAQGIGYLIAGLGPLAFGLLHGMTGGWEAPISLMFALLACQAVAGWHVAGDRHIEPASADVPSV